VDPSHVRGGRSSQAGTLSRQGLRLHPGQSRDRAAARGAGVVVLLLAGHLELLLLDEPFEGLAPAVREAIFGSLDRLRREVPILIVEHDLDLVLALADRVYVLDRGRVTHEGPAAPLRLDRDLRRQVLWV
jgi:ABC-type branched-subunit amino acid transport system ATPase component